MTTFSNNLLINYIATYDIFETVKLEDLDTVLPGCVRVEVLSFHKLQSGRFLNGNIKLEKVGLFSEKSGPPENSWWNGMCYLLTQLHLPVSSVELYCSITPPLPVSRTHIKITLFHNWIHKPRKLSQLYCYTILMFTHNSHMS